jgi:hypothetical protein
MTSSGSGFGDQADFMIVRPGEDGNKQLIIPQRPQVARFAGIFRVEVWRRAPLTGTRHHTETIFACNNIVNQGLTDILEHYFNPINDSARDWYLGLINGPTPTIPDTDTYTSHGGWTENTNYSETTRPAWGPGAAAANSITNGTQVTFSIDTDTQDIDGIMIADDNTKGETTGGGILWSTAPFASNALVDDGDQLKITYTVNSSNT